MAETFQAAIRDLFANLFSGVVDVSRMEQIASRWEKDDEYLGALEEIKQFEKNLGPVGIWCASYNQDREFSYVYPLHYDDIYRELKYVYMPLFTGSPMRVAVTREIVSYSIAHVEGCLKRLCGRKGILKSRNASLGSMARLKSLESFVDKGLLENLRLLATNIGNPSKHLYGLYCQGSMFGSQDALMAYLCCRKLGFELLAGAGEIPIIEQALKDGPLLNPRLKI